MKFKKLLFSLIAIGLLTSSIQYSLASFSNTDKIENNRIKTGIWNPGRLTITEVLYDPAATDLGSEWIRVRNTGGYQMNLTGYLLHFDVVGTNHFVFPDMILEPKKELIVHLRTDGTNTATNLYWPNTGDLNLNNIDGSVSLFKKLPKNSANIVDYVEYGAGGQPQEAMAVNAGIWTAGAFIADANEGYSLRLINNLDNNLVADWRHRLIPL